MKQVVFPPDAGKLFDVTYIAVLTGHPPRTIEETRHIVKILDATEAISTETPDARPGASPRALHADGGTIILEDATHTHLLSMIAAAGIIPGAARDKLRAYDLVKGAAEYTPPKPESAAP